MRAMFLRDNLDKLIGAYGDIDITVVLQDYLGRPNYEIEKIIVPHVRDFEKETTAEMLIS